VVALGGDGGDELFGGYDSYLDAWLLDMYQIVPPPLRRLALPLIRKLKKNAPESFFKGLEADTNSRKYLTFMGKDEEEIQKIYPSDQDETIRSLLKLRGFGAQKIRFHTLLPLLDLMHWLPEESLMRTDKMTMQWSLEQRVPFLDNEVIDLANRIPFAWKVGWRFRKKILREAFSELLPQPVLRAPKRGFFSPGAKWLRDKNWKPFVYETLSEKRINQGEIFGGREVEKMLADHNSGVRYNLYPLWAVLTFEAWYRQNFQTY
jgi:asparagine synthase (glutamine-hydrolysing)